VNVGVISFVEQERVGGGGFIGSKVNYRADKGGWGGGGYTGFICLVNYSGQILKKGVGEGVVSVTVIIQLSLFLQFFECLNLLRS